jgi:hypothetical protein
MRTVENRCDTRIVIHPERQKESPFIARAQSAQHHSVLDLVRGGSPTKENHSASDIL